LFTGSLAKIEYTVIVHPFMRVTYPRTLMSLVHTTRVYTWWETYSMGSENSQEILWDNVLNICM